MRILVTNDDGVHSEWLWFLARALSDVGHVCVVAPDRDQSGIGTAMTLRNVVRVNEFPPPVDSVQSYSVQGTPSDCVVLATETLFSEPFDLVISGINTGMNLGLDVWNSGTVGAAFNGFYRGIPSIAISAAPGPDMEARYGAAAHTAKTLARALGNSPLEGTPLLNVNLPDVEPSAIERVEITRLGPRPYLENVEREQEGRSTYYRIRHERPVSINPTKGTDIWAVRNKRVSITPLHLLLSDSSPSPALQTLADEVHRTLGLP